MKIDVSEVIDRSEVRPFHWIVVCLGALVTVIDGFDLVAMGMVVPSLSDEWALDPSAFSGALSAALIGVLFGSAAAGSMGDAIGRRWTLIIMMVIATVFMGMTVAVTSMTELTIYRFCTGFGAGGSIPVAIALTSEYMPARHRNVMVTLMYSGAALGSVMGGFVGPTLIERFGWQGIFWLGAVLPAAVCVLLVLFLPESLRFLVTRNKSPERADALLSRIDPSYSPSDGGELVVHEPAKEGSALSELFGGWQTSMTLMVWLVFFANQFLIFFVGLWLPTVFTESGLLLAGALFTLAVYNLGGALGGPALGWISDRASAQRVLLWSYPMAAVGLVLLGFVMESPVLRIVVGFFTGAAAIGSSLCLGSMTASLYPTRARSTGVGWALSIGRFGSIIAPLIGGLVVSRSLQGFFMIAAIAPLLAGVGIYALSKITRGRTFEATGDTPMH